MQTELDRRGWVPADLARAAGISHTRLTRWREGQAPSVDAARAVATAFGVPLLTVLVAAGLLTAEEAGQQSVSPPDPQRLTDEQLAAEMLRRMKSPPTERPQLTRAEIEANPDRYEVIEIRRQGGPQRVAGSPDPDGT